MKPSSTPRINRCTVLLAATLICVGCTTRGYDGPELPKSDLSTIALYPSGSVTLLDAQINQTSFGMFAKEMSVLPGTHRIKTRYRMELSTCYQSEYCDLEVALGTCEGTVAALAGRSYLVTIAERAGMISAKVSPKSYFDFSERADEPAPGRVFCTELSRNTVYQNKKY